MMATMAVPMWLLVLIAAWFLWHMFTRRGRA